MSGQGQTGDLQPYRKMHVHVLGAIILVLIPASMLIGGPQGVLSYLAGLFNSITILGGVFFLFLLSPVILIGAAVLGIRDFWRGRAVSCGCRWTTAILLVFCGAMVVPLALSFGPMPCDMQLSGLHTYARGKTDVPSIQAWLATLDPNDCQGQFVGVRYDPNQLYGPKSIPSPPCLGRLRHVGARLKQDSTGHPMVEVWLGGSGFLGHWGITVGDPNMGLGAPERMETDHREHRVPLAPGAYVWDHD